MSREIEICMIRVSDWTRFRHYGLILNDQLIECRQLEGNLGEQVARIAFRAISGVIAEHHATTGDGRFPHFLKSGNFRILKTFRPA